MSKITAVDNLKTQNWLITFDDLSSHYADLQIGFTEEAPIVHFNNLKFGFTLSQAGETVNTMLWPPAGVRYVRSDQQYLVTHRLRFNPDTQYELHLWAENANIRIEHTETFVTPLPPQPYASWTWDGSQWQPPVPYPEDGGDYEWDESSSSWQAASEEI